MRTTDVVVIGGGAIGCASALRIAQAGFRTLLIERSSPGAEASTAAAGILAPPAEAGPGALYDLGVRSLAMYSSFVAELRGLAGLEAGLHRCGSIVVALDDVSLARLAREHAWRRDRGTPMELLDARKLHELEPALHPGLAGGLLFADDAQVDTRLLMAALAAAVERAGVSVVTGEVRRVIETGGKVHGVEIDGEFIGCARVVVAAGSWSSGIQGAGLPEGSIRPVRGQVVVLETRAPILSRMIFGPTGYVVPRGDRRVILGSTTEEVGFEKEVTVAGMRSILETAIGFAPRLAEQAIVAQWSGLRPATRDLLPVIGRTSIEGLVVATGHYRHGILLAPVTAEIVRDLVTTDATVGAVASFSPARLAA